MVFPPRRQRFVSYVLYACPAVLTYYVTHRKEHQHLIKERLMSQRRLKLVSTNFVERTKLSKLDSVKCKPLPVNCSGSRLAAKSVRLHLEHPEAAALIEQLIDDCLSGTWP